MRPSRRKGYSEKRGGSELNLKGTPTSDGRCDFRSREKNREGAAKPQKCGVSKPRECVKSLQW